MSNQNGNSTAVSNSISSSKGKKSFMIFQQRRRVQLVLDFIILFLIIVAKDFSQYEPIFLQMSEDKKTVNAFELADLLEACLPNGKTSWRNTYRVFHYFRNSSLALYMYFDINSGFE